MWMEIRMFTMFVIIRWKFDYICASSFDMLVHD